MSFSMEIASPEEIQAAIEQEVKPVPEEVVKLKEMADANVATIMTLDIESLANRKEILQSIEAFGLNTMRSSSEKNALLQVSIGKCPRPAMKAVTCQGADRASHAAARFGSERGRFREDNNLIASTSRMLKTQGAEIQKQSLETNISVDTLKQAFSDVMSALDSISAYKQDALPKMRQTINQFRELGDDGEKQIHRLARGHKLGL